MTGRPGKKQRKWSAIISLSATRSIDMHTGELFYFPNSSTPEAKVKKIAAKIAAKNAETARMSIPARIVYIQKVLGKSLYYANKYRHNKKKS